MIAQPRAMSSGRAPRLMRGCGRGEGVADVVAAGHLEVNLTQLFPMVYEREVLARTCFLANLGCEIVVFLSDAEKVTTRISGRRWPFRVFVVAVYHQQSFGLGGKLMEGVDDVLQILEIIEVVGVDVENDGDRGRQLEIGVHTRMPRTPSDRFSHTAVPAQQGQLAADDGGGVHSGRQKTCVSMAVVVVFPCVPETATASSYRLVTMPSSTERSTVRNAARARP